MDFVNMARYFELLRRIGPCSLQKAIHEVKELNKVVSSNVSFDDAVEYVVKTNK